MIPILIAVMSLSAAPDMTSIQSLLGTYKGQIVEVISPGMTARQTARLVAAGSDAACLDDVVEASAPAIPNAAVRCFPYSRIHSVVIPHSGGDVIRPLIRLVN